MIPSHLAFMPSRYDTYMKAAMDLENDIKEKYDRDITDMLLEDLALMVRIIIRSPCAA